MKRVVMGTNSTFPIKRSCARMQKPQRCASCMTLQHGKVQVQPHSTSAWKWAIAGDLKQAFLQILVHGADRDALRFHWLKDLRSKQVETLRFTRVLFGLAPSPFLLAAVIKEDLQRYKSVNPKLVEEIERSMYVDDLITGRESVKQALEAKQTAQTIFNEATFELHKW